MSRGYTMLLVLLLLAAAAALAMAGLSLASGERQAAAGRRNAAAALAIAQAGLERTRGYLALLADRDGDLDRALDPALNDDCLVLGAPAHAEDDGLPTFGDGAPAAAGGAGRAFMRVAFAGGAFLVRVDDDDDDRPGSGPAWATDNHPGPALNCLEGTGVQNPARDRNRTVVVTVVGIYPGTDPATALATRVLRARIGPPAQTYGLIAGGDVDFGGASSVSGPYASVWSTGSVAIDHLAGSTAEAGGTCEANGSPCAGGQSGPPAPRCSPWEATNAPVACAGPSCTPFYYARLEGSPALAHLFMWSYGTAGCADPRAFGRLCYPAPVSGPADTGAGACPSCWTQVFVATPGPDQAKIALSESAALGAPTPPPVPPDAPPVLEATGTGSTGAGCSDPGLGPGPASLWPPGARPLATFRPLAGHLPRGVWFLEGSLEVDTDVDNCALAPASVIALGDVRLTTGAARLRLPPAAPRGYAVLAGRDLALTAGNEYLDTCGQPGAVMAHEQFTFQGNDTVEAQLVVENAAACSALVSGSDAVHVTGDASLVVNQPGPVPLGPAVAVREWAESGL